MTNTDDEIPRPSTGLPGGIDSPEDLRRLAPSQLRAVCDDLRAFLLDSVPRTGGHLGSNLGVVELSCALHHCFDFRRDRLVWDVGHQAYVHKLLTGRRGRFHTLRKTDGLCGFTHPEESEYDLFHTGHAGTSISLALGLALGYDAVPDPPHVVAAIGDASLGAGVAFEALNHAGALSSPLLVVLNDNEWSIARSVGAMARYFSRIRSSRLVQRSQQEIQSLINAIPVIGGKASRALDQIGEVVRHSLVPGHVFEELGVAYVGPIDGHDVERLVENLQRVKRLDGVVLLHVLTEKGKGHPEATDHPERVHGVSPAPAVGSGEEAGKVGGASPAGRAAASPPGPPYTAVLSKALVRAADRDARVRAVTAAMPSGTGLDAFALRFPGRFIDTGITEQHAVALSAGLARAGMRPVAAIYSTFLQRGYDQVFQEVALQGLPVVFCLDRAGLVGQDGPTHHGLFDIAYLRTLPGMVLCAPRDASDLERMLTMALALDGPTALRYPRAATPEQETIHADERRPMEPGTAEVLSEGRDVVLWAYGALVGEAQAAAELLRTAGIEVGVVDARFAKPIDTELLARHARDHRHIVTVEEHQRSGGFGSAVLEAHHRLPNPRARVRILGVGDRFVPHMTSRTEQLAASGIDAAGIARVVRALVGAERAEGAHEA
ncbi:MAG: 1-deoxy-D-xylulose-5-phosphate synthase [Planctomycetota bacterium]|jgi:1-deoxy-D-xylulose-5-phosphate synthase|nr:1-deoxy-D-xylulose-5-phosphate synthase [Planctomycetota bacterium]MDP6989565.1 1-deoxy-D-xylulose-5-phosphate synthase [Planctomycetota bacterium]